MGRSRSPWPLRGHGSLEARLAELLGSGVPPPGFDRILDVLPCRTAAAATVQVGNGARTTLFHDHLLLGRTGARWRILSKTFAPRAWPQG